MTENDEQRPTVMVSGGFDPVHVGHIRMILEASQYGDVIVIANTDSWLHRKKGFVFMEWDRRCEILNALKGVVLVDSVDDSDGTVCEAIERLKPTYFANGGDRDYFIPVGAGCPFIKPMCLESWWAVARLLGW